MRQRAEALKPGGAGELRLMYDASRVTIREEPGFVEGPSRVCKEIQSDIKIVGILQASRAATSSTNKQHWSISQMPQWI